MFRGKRHFVSPPNGVWRQQVSGQTLRHLRCVGCALWTDRKPLQSFPWDLSAAIKALSNIAGQGPSIGAILPTVR